MSVPTICEPFCLSTSVARSCVGCANGAWIDIMYTRLAPSDAMNSACLPACRWLLGCVRMRYPWCGSLVMESAPDTVVRNVLLSQHSGATAVVTADAQVPMMAGTLVTSISLRAARTAASGFV